MSKLELYWRGRMPVQNVEWHFSPHREQVLSEPLEKKREEIWKTTLKSYPDTYDGKVLTLENFHATENSISMDLGFIRFSRVLTLDHVRAAPQGYGCLGVQAVLFSTDRKYLLIGQRAADLMYCPLYYAVPGGILEVSDIENEFDSACLREVSEEVDIEIDLEKEVVALVSELHGTVGVAAIITGTVSGSVDDKKEITGNEEWRENRLSWHPISALNQFVPDNSLEGLLLVKDEWERFQATGQSVFW